MLTPRIYHPELIGTQTQLHLTENASRHLVSVLRHRVNTKLCIFDGSGVEYHAVLIEPHKRRAIVKVTRQVAVDRESELAITLIQAIAKSDKMDFVIQKAVELGVSTFVPVFTEFGNVKLSTDRIQKRLQHWQGVVISASEQCGRNRLMQIEAPMKLTQWLAKMEHTSDAAQWRLLISPTGQQRLRDIATQSLPTQVSILIGCEGGFSDAECQLAEQHGFIPLQLGKRILRTETAGLAVVSALQACCGDI